MFISINFFQLVKNQVLAQIGGTSQHIFEIIALEYSLRFHEIFLVKDKFNNNEQFIV